MIRVLFIGMTKNPGGLETYIINIFSQLQNHGFQFYFINCDNEKLAYSSYIKKHHGIIYNVYINSDNKWNYFSRFYIARHFFKYHHKFNVVHLNALNINELYWLKAAKKYGIKSLFIQSHNCGNNFRSKIFSSLSKLLNCINKFYLLGHPKICKLAADYNCGKWMFGKHSNFAIIPNGINTKNYFPNNVLRLKYKKELNIPYNNKVIITTARLEPQKNYLKTLKVFKAVNKLDKNINLVIIGNGTEFHLIKRLINNYELNSYVYLLGSKSKKEVSKLLNISDLMLMPSLYEAIPFSLTEAQASGIPALVSLEGIPKDANLTGKVKYLSLKDSNYVWGKEAITIIHETSYNIKNRIMMNTQISKSKYNYIYSVNKIKNIYKTSCFYS